jgi:hypothetical protein
LKHFFDFFGVFFQDVLAEVPSQVAEYMEKNGFTPGVPDVDTALNIQQMRL